MDASSTDLPGRALRRMQRELHEKAAASDSSPLISPDKNERSDQTTSEDDKGLAALIVRLDLSAGLIAAHRGDLEEAVYAEMVSQAFVYAHFLTECKQLGMHGKDIRVRDALEEIAQFCDFLLEAYPT